MKNTIFIKESFIKTLTSSADTVEEAGNIPENFVNRKEYLKETCMALNSAEQKLISLSGFQGTGKTEFINTLLSALEENILNFYYECSSITHLDDIILSLFNYLKKIAMKNPEYKRAFKISNSQSIDERLINFIKSINIPLLIVIDGFENFTEEQDDLVHFLEFLSSLPQIKIIIAGRKINLNSLKASSFELRLAALEEQEAYNILKDNGLTETESGLHQIFQVTRGYPENLLWFSNTVKTLKITSFDLMQEYYSKDQNSFEEFIYNKIYKSIPDEFLKIICFFTAIRHSVTAETLKNLDFSPNISEKINYLLSQMILTQNRGDFYIKSLLKNTIYSNLSAEEKKQIHRYLYELYSEQISKKLEERIFSVSRKLLYLEQYYHYMCLINFGDKSLPDLKTTTLSNLKPDFKYLYVNITDSLFTGKSENESSVVINDDQEREDLKKNMKSDSQIAIQLLPDDKIALSEEEKALLEEENNDEDLSLSPIDFSSELIQASKENEPFLSAKPNLQASTPASRLEEKTENLKSEARVFYEQGKFDDAAKKLEEALILYEITRDKTGINSTLLSIANIYNEGYRHDVALMYYYRILNTEDDSVEPYFKIESLCGIADIYDYREDFNNALKFYQKALDGAEKSNNIKQQAKVCFKKALAYDDLGDFDRALDFYHKNTALSGDIEENQNLAAVYANMAAIYEERENLSKAKECYLQSLKFDKLLNNKEGQYETLSNIGNIYFEVIDYQNASDCFHEALAIARETGDDYKIAMSCLDIGDIYLQQKYYEKALKAFIIAGKTIDKTISTDSKEKIDRRFRKIISEIGEYSYKQIIEKLKKKHG